MGGIAHNSGRGWAAARRGVWAAALLAGLAAGLTACTGDPPAAQRSAALAGGWQMLAGGCAQHLALQDDGGFALGVRLAVGGLTWRGQVIGTYQGPARVDGNRAATVRFAPVAANSTAARAYCAGWAGVRQTPLPLAALLAGGGLTPDAVQLESEPDPALEGTLILGVDAARTARLAALRGTDGALRLWLLDDALAGQTPLYHARGGDPGRDLAAGSGISVVDLPGQVYRTPATLPPGDVLEVRLLLNIAAAVRIAFLAIPGTGTAPCKFVLYTSGDFLTAAGVSLQTGSLDANPLAGDLPYFSPPGSDALVLAVGVHSLAGSACSGRIAGRALVAALLEEALAGGQVPDATLTLPEGASLWAGAAPAAAQSLALLPLDEDALTAAGQRPTGTLLTAPRIAAAEGDPLGLGSGAGRSLLARLQAGPGAASLVLTPAAGDGTSIGPLWPYAARGGTGGDAWPGSLSGSFAADETVRVHEVLTADATPLLVTVSVSAGLPLAAELVDARGRVWAAADAGPAGVADLELAVAAPAGRYRLLLRGDGSAGGYTVEAVTEPAGGVADAALRQCLLDHRRAQGDTLRELACPGRGIVSLQGLEAVTSLLRADFSGNAIDDVAPLSALGRLQALSLDGNAVRDATPLLGLGRLHRLSLVRNPLDAATRAALGTASAPLSVLNLRGVTTLGEDEAAALKAALPETLLVTPAGQVLD
ncbi:MAG: hypothetical protein HY342_03135 [Candidatus Lambdaproteobacteria bacterium]|nr:hypothetical protein [Candidatus Lambdaproteobacteria bacterium]